MLDLQFIRENPGLVAEAAQHKGYKVNVERLLELDEAKRQKVSALEQLRQERNQLSGGGKGKPTDEQVAKGRELKDAIAKLESELTPVSDELLQLYKAIPNVPFKDVPVGASEKENVVVKDWGTKPQYDFEPKNHWQIAEPRGLIDKDRAAKVTGSRFAYLKGGLVKLQFAIIQYVLDTLTNESIVSKLINDNNLGLSPKTFTPILPPVMIREDVYDQMDRLEPREDRYHIEGQDDNLWLIGSAEHTLGSMYAGEIIPEADLPIRYIGYSTSFRQEAGTYGKDMEGIVRLHQFDKLELEVFSTKETSFDEHLLLIAVQEYMMQDLGLPYHVLQKCTADIGKPNARGIDIEAWLPGQGLYRETHTADYMTDYQSRRLQTRVRRADGSIELVHTNDATAFALGRTLIAIIENYQLADGQIAIPKSLQSYMNGKDKI